VWLGFVDQVGTSLAMRYDNVNQLRGFVLMSFYVEKKHRDFFLFLCFSSLLPAIVSLCSAFDLGYDVWAGTLRGCDGECRSVENLEPKQYWDFSVNEHAWEDIPAFLAQIRAAKERELMPKGTQIALHFRPNPTLSILTHKKQWRTNSSRRRVARPHTI
jgi:hypothetical protein